MSSKADRKLRKKTVRSMLNLGHYKFHQRLKEVAEKRGVTVIECDEAYTSKTCSCCGWIHPQLGGRKEFVCKECCIRIDRDLQGAFNIFLKYASTHPEILLGM
jgi:putative transposase